MVPDTRTPHLARPCRRGQKRKTPPQILRQDHYQRTRGPSRRCRKRELRCHLISESVSQWIGPGEARALGRLERTPTERPRPSCVCPANPGKEPSCCLPTYKRSAVPDRASRTRATPPAVAVAAHHGQLSMGPRGVLNRKPADEPLRLDRRLRFRFVCDGKKVRYQPCWCWTGRIDSPCLLC